MAWWPTREASERAWKVLAATIAANGYRADITNPNAKADFEHLPPEQLADDSVQKELRVHEVTRDIKDSQGGRP